MHIKNSFLISIFLFGVIITKTFSAEHYIDKYAAGNNDGTSWENAWNSFYDINWDNINPGDIIYISGGTDSTTYFEYLDVDVSGTVDNPIFITSGIDVGHSGKVIIDGMKTYPNVINITSREFVVVSNLYLRNSYDSVIEVKRSDDIRIESCFIHSTTRSGIGIASTERVTISNCIITTDTLIDHQTDGIYSQNSINNIYEYNYIVISNQDPDGHDDCIQSYKDNSLTVRNNYVEQRNSKTSNAQGIYISTPIGSDTTRIYNNIFNSTLASSNGITFNSTSNTSARVQIIGNTVYGETLSSQYRIIGAVDPTIKNNIGYSKYGNSILTVNNVSISDASLVDNNIWKCNNNEPVILNGSQKSWSSWRTSGYDQNSYRTNPKFIDIANRDFTLQSSSVGIDHGQSLYAPYNSDIIGNLRPKGNGWDIGSYESDFSASVNTSETGLTEFELFQNYPNPFNPNTKIRYSISELRFTTLKVYDILGKEVSTLVNESMPAGSYEIDFNSIGLPSGIYFYMLKSGSFVETKKMILIK